MGIPDLLLLENGAPGKRNAKEYPARKEPLREEESTNDLAFRLDKEGISLNRFWVDRTTIQSVQAGGSVQRLYAQTKQKSDFYTLFFQKKDRVYLIGTSTPLLARRFVHYCRS